MSFKLDDYLIALGLVRTSRRKLRLSLNLQRQMFALGSAALYLCGSYEAGIIRTLFPKS